MSRTREEFEKFFDELDEDNKEYLKFERVKEKLSNRPDLHAMLLIEKLVPGEGDIIGGADHDIVWIETDLEKLGQVITDEQALDLRRCGVHWDTENDCLAMFA